MKTAISLPDELFRKVDRKARQLGLSRSEFLARAAQRYLETLQVESVTASYDQAFADDDQKVDRFRQKASRAALLAVEWRE